MVLDQGRKAAFGEKVAAGVLAVVLAAAAVAVTPIASWPGPEVPGFIPAFSGAMMVIDLVLAVLLFSKGAIGRRAPPIRLGTAYLFAALIIVPHVSTFPGAIVPNGLLGGVGSAVWLWTFWHTGFALAILGTLVGRDAEARPRAIPIAVVTTGVAVGVLTLVATLGLPYLPPILNGRVFHVSAFAYGLQVVVVAINLIALALVTVRFRLRSAEDLWLAVAMLAACVDVWLTFRSGTRFALGWYLGRVASLMTSTVVLISMFCDITELYGTVARANRLLERLAHVDGLTGLANRRQLDATLDVEWRRAQRDGQPLSILMLDVDHFKRFNDRYGHQEGDRCLRLIATCLGAVARRPGDMAARYGGEEFALVLPSTELSGALHLANELRLAVRTLALPHEAVDPPGVVTVSVGVASALPRTGDDAATLVAEADAALYRAKQAGRDQVQPSFELLPIWQPSGDLKLDPTVERDLVAACRD